MFAPALFLALALAWLWPVPTRLTTRIAHDLGDPLLNTWILWWNTQAVPFTERWWNAPFFHPVPGTLALSEHLFGIAVFTAPLHVAGLSPAGAYNVALILSAWLSGWFAFLLARKLTGSAVAGVIAGIGFGFGPYRVGQLSHLQVLTAQWMPLALYAMHSYLDDRRLRWLAVFAAAWLLQAWSNGYFLLFFPLLIGLWLAWFVRWRDDPRPGLVLALTFVAASMLLVPSLLAYKEVHEAMGLGRSRNDMLLFSAEPASLLRMPDLLKFWPYFEPKTQEDLLFPGVTAIAVVFTAFVAGVRRVRFSSIVGVRSPLAFYAAATLMMWWLAFGPAAEQQPWHTWVLKPYTFLTLLPGFNGLRVPSRFAMLASLTLSIAAAVAFARVAPRTPRVRGVLAGVLFAGLLVDGWPGAIELHAPPGRIQVPPVKDAVMLELPLDRSAVGTAAMYRSIEHRLPLVTGFSGHFPTHYLVLSSAIEREDPSAVTYFAEGRPLVIAVNHRYDPDGWIVKYVRSIPGIVEHGGSSVGPLFMLPPRTRRHEAPLGEPLKIARMRQEPRDHTVIDLGQPQLVRAVGFPVRWHYEAFAARFEVEASDDGVTWRSVWLDWTGAATLDAALQDQRLVPVRIPLPDVRARYLRVHPAPPWMVPELSVY